MSQHRGLNLIRQTGIIAIMRAENPDDLLYVADAVCAGGVRAIEVTLNTPGALAVIEQAVGRYNQDILFGAGTVLDAESARVAILAGAQFVVSPTFNPATVEMCRRYSIPVIPGAFTPTEIVAAWEGGADMVKIFPVNLGGPDLIKILKGPLAHVEMVAVGNVTLENVAAYIRAGVAAVGLGSALITPKLLVTKDFTNITTRARRFIETVKIVRSG